MTTTIIMTMMIIIITVIMCAQLHFNICKEIGIQLDVGMTLYRNQLKQVMKVKNQRVRTERTIPINKPDIIISDNKQGTCMLIDVAIPGHRNVIKKEAEKILKYKDLII
jgi:hypothetical protein